MDIEQKLNNLIGHSPLQVVNHPLLDKKQLSLSIKRDDLLHPDISGNKWRKLKYNLIHAQQIGCQHLISFGGAYSNHIHALAAASYHLQLQATGVIRGEPHFIENPTLTAARKWAMQLQFVDRKTYRLREQSAFLDSLQKQFPDAFIIPEGGSNQYALPGVKEIVAELVLQTTKPIDHIFTATGSAGTLSGLLLGAQQYTPNTKVHGVAVLKGADYLLPKVQAFTHCKDNLNWQLHLQFHGGGYAKVSRDLQQFCQQFTQQTSIPIEPIYTGKMFYGLWQLIEQDFFNKGQHIVAIHTGGLQGLAGLKAQNKIQF